MVATSAFERAAEAEAEAVRLCNEGDHLEAAFIWLKACDRYREAGDHIAAAQCIGQSKAETLAHWGAQSVDGRPAIGSAGCRGPGSAPPTTRSAESVDVTPVEMLVVVVAVMLVTMVAVYRWVDGREMLSRRASRDLLAVKGHQPTRSFYWTARSKMVSRPAPQPSG